MEAHGGGEHRRVGLAGQWRGDRGRWESAAAAVVACGGGCGAMKWLYLRVLASLVDVLRYPPATGRLQPQCSLISPMRLCADSFTSRPPLLACPPPLPLRLTAAAPPSAAVTDRWWAARLRVVG